jgi:hypothetical protein
MVDGPRWKRGRAKLRSDRTGGVTPPHVQLGPGGTAAAAQPCRSRCTAHSRPTWVQHRLLLGRRAVGVKEALQLLVELALGHDPHHNPRAAGAPRPRRPSGGPTAAAAAAAQVRCGSEGRAQRDKGSATSHSHPARPVCIERAFR